MEQGMDMNKFIVAGIACFSASFITQKSDATITMVRSTYK